MIGREIGNYRITHRLGEGGVGEIFAGVDLVLNRPVAIKVLRPELGRDPAVVARFRSEAISLARLNHPSITTLYVLHVEDDILFMVMEVVRGRTLEELLTSTHSIAERESLAITSQVLGGIGYAHAVGVIHRDIKPGNLMVAASGLVKIMDFGIARVRGSGRLTKHGHIVGTLAYMAPEQIKGEEGDERSDIYSLAIVLYEMLSGTPPFVCKSEYELIRAQVEAPPPRLQDRCPALPPHLEEALMRALEKQPDDRFQTAAEFGAALGLDQLGGRAIELVARRFGENVVAATRLDAANCAPLRAQGASIAGAGTAPTRLAQSSDSADLRTRFADLPGDRAQRRQPRLVVLVGVALVAALVCVLGYAFHGRMKVDVLLPPEASDVSPDDTEPNTNEAPSSVHESGSTASAADAGEDPLIGTDSQHQGVGYDQLDRDSAAAGGNASNQVEAGVDSERDSKASADSLSSRQATTPESGSGPGTPDGQQGEEQARQVKTESPPVRTTPAKTADTKWKINH